MVNQLRPAVVMMALFTLLLGLAYPLAVTGIAQARSSPIRPKAAWCAMLQARLSARP